MYAACLHVIPVQNLVSMVAMYGSTSLGAACSRSSYLSRRSPTPIPAQPPLDVLAPSQCRCQPAAALPPQRRQPTTAQHLRNSEPWQACQRSRTDRLVCCSAAGAAEPGKTRIGFLGAGIMGTPMVRAAALTRPFPDIRGW